MKAQTFVEHQKQRIEKLCQKKSFFQRPRSKHWDQKHGLHTGDITVSKRDYVINFEDILIGCCSLFLILLVLGIHLKHKGSVSLQIFIMGVVLLFLVGNIVLFIRKMQMCFARRLSPELYIKFENFLNQRQNSEYFSWMISFVNHTGPIRARAFSFLGWIDDSMRIARKKDEELLSLIQELNWPSPPESSEKELKRYLKRCLKEVRKRDKDQTYKNKQLELQKAWKDLQNVEENSEFEKLRQSFEEQKLLSNLSPANQISKKQRL